MVFSIKFVSDLGRWFFFRFLGTLGSSINKPDQHDTTEILLKMVSKTITLTQIKTCSVFSVQTDGIRGIEQPVVPYSLLLKNEIE